MTHRKDELSNLLMTFAVALQEISPEEYEQLSQGKGSWRFVSNRYHQCPREPNPKETILSDDPVEGSIEERENGFMDSSDSHRQKTKEKPQRRKTKGESKSTTQKDSLMVNEELIQQSANLLLTYDKREEARRYIMNAKHLSKKADLEKLAGLLNIRIRKSEAKSNILDRIVEATAGLKANTMAIEMTNVRRRD
ncbi:hypothetical protein GJ688_16435 [Heliobacillus mobilis]|uniref:Uncharacterized protein n=1 Tax=Heliobacterium mobile TaxID=28064 RepID=A0A6I3SNE2_HELMO|nr:hypothetical protein [Heliobacterium mobile]MTV50534.1 hypothetical protein [Heliobacterium mobile]